MGQIRARTAADIAARKKEILDTTAILLEKYEYEDLTLAIIAKEISISRPSLYNYYKTKEEIYLDLLKREYLSWAEELNKAFRTRMSREEFCRILAEMLCKRHLIMQLFTVRLSKLIDLCGNEAMTSYNHDTQPFYAVLSDVLRRQFPNADEDKRNMFKVQLTMYCYSIYPFSHIPQNYAQEAAEQNMYGELLPVEEIVFKGLMLLSAELS